MTQFMDVLLPRPIGPFFYNTLEFFFFLIHFIFVLLTLGTLFFGIVAAVIQRRGGMAALPTEPPTSHSSMPVYFASKSLTLTFGVAVLLFVVAFHSVPFVGAANLNGAFWMAIVLFLIAAFVFVEVFEKRSKVTARAHDTATLGFGVAGLVLLYCVPAIFVAFVVTAENPDRWGAIFHHGVVFTPLALHWIVRLLHVFGAGIVITGLFFLIFPGRTYGRFAVNPPLLFGALLLQMLVGILLYMTLPRRATFSANLFVMLGAAGALGFAWLLFSRQRSAGRPALWASLALILLPMLLARQVLQNDALRPFSKRIDGNARRYAAVLKKLPPADNPYLSEKYDAHNMPQFIFQRSCVFCHGGAGNGQGREAGNLAIAPADLTLIRTRPAALMDAVRRGVPGSAMPYFSVYTDGALKGLVRFLYDKVGIRAQPEPLPVPLTQADRQEAAIVFSQHCVLCHGQDGRVSAGGRELKPAPPDLRQWAMQPQGAYNVISMGVRGTAMQGHYQLPERVRWALVEKTNGFYVNAGRER